MLMDLEIKNERKCKEICDKKKKKKKKKKIFFGLIYTKEGRLRRRFFYAVYILQSVS
jgi:hypothetical protein